MLLYQPKLVKKGPGQLNNVGVPQATKAPRVKIVPPAIPELVADYIWVFVSNANATGMLINVMLNWVTVW